jgi:WD40 repeat protein
MGNETPTSVASEKRFQEVLARLLQAEERGETIDLSQAIRGAPDLERPLREYFRNRDLFYQLAPELADVATSPGAALPPLYLEPGSQFGDYQILGELGRGGMGVVYKARQLSLQRLVALKMILAGQLASEDHVKRFHREAQAVARLEHPNIVPVYTVGRHNGQHYFSMKLIEGRSLSADLAHYRRHHRAAAHLMSQVARAVHFAHQRGIIHRDLKPGNILLDEHKQPHVTDFGLAKRLDASASLSPEGAVIGTASYMAPEQAAACVHRLTPAADVYSLGAILYELLTGQPPFRGDTVVETLRQVLDCEPPPPCQLNSAVPRDLETICLRCLDKRPTHRYASAAALADDLERWAEGKPIQARRVGPAERAWLWCRRKPALAALAALSAAAVVLVMLAGTLYSAYSLVSRKADVAGQQVVEARENLDQEQERRRARAYLVDMGRAQKYVRAGELIQARDLLAKWLPEEGKTDLRAWEWYFIDAQLRDAGFSQREHTAAVLAVAWNPDGKRLASADSQGTVKIWDVVARKKLHDLSFKIGMSALAWRSALAWSPDGKRLAAAWAGAVPFKGGTVQIWDAETGKSLLTLHQADDINRPSSIPPPPGADQEALVASLSRRVFRGSWSASLLWNPRNEKLALADEDGKVQVWDLSTNKKDPLVLRAHEGGVHYAAWSPDGNRLASVSGDGLVKIWGTATDKPIKAVSIRAADNKDPMTNYALAWAEGGKRLNVVSSDGEIQVVDLASSKVTPSCKLVSPSRWAAFGADRIGTHQERFIWSPDGKRLASIQMGGLVIFWDTATGKQGASLAAPCADGLTTVMCSPAWDSRGQRLALGGSDGTVVVRPVPPTRQPVRRPIRELAINEPLGWSANSRHILAPRDYSQDNVDYLKEQKKAADAQMEAMREAFKQGPGALPPPRVIMPRPGPDQPGAAARKPRPEISVYDAISGELVRTLGNNVRPAVLADSPPDGKWVAAATGDGLLQLWPAAGGEPVTLEKRAPPASPVGPPTGSVVLSWSPDGKRLAFSSPRHTTIRLWDPANPRNPAQTLEGHGASLRSLAWSRDGTRLASASDDGTVKVWEVSSGKEVSTFLYYIIKPRAIGVMAKCHPSAVSLSPDGKQLAVAGEDQTIRILDVDTKEELKTLHGQPARYDRPELVCAVAWSPDGKRLAGASPDGTFLLWDTTTWNEVLELRPASSRLLGMVNRVGALAWSPDGRQLASLSSSVLIWDATPQ